VLGLLSALETAVDPSSEVAVPLSVKVLVAAPKIAAVAAWSFAILSQSSVEVVVIGC